MPELPEVETIRRQLEPELVGRRIERAEVLDDRWTRPEPPVGTEEALAGRRVETVGRRGKYLVVGLDDGSALVMHLRMTGNLLLRPPGSSSVADLMDAALGGPRLYEAQPEARHLRARLWLDDGSELWFTDARRFGHGVVLRADEIDPYFAARLGLEPLSDELTPERLGALAAGRRAPLKSFLLNQSGIAGIGNIYADEALFRASFTRSRRPARCGPSTVRRSARGSSRRSSSGSTTAAPRSTTTVTPAASAARCRRSFSSTPARASRACAAASRSGGSWSRAGRPISAPAVSGGCGRARAGAAPGPAGAERVGGSSGRRARLAGPMPGKFKTEAVVLRSIRYGEADRVLHLYSATRGRIGAIAKGVRRPRSRFGGRLEPFFRLDLVLHEGRGDLADGDLRPHGQRALAPACQRPRARRRGARLRRGAAAARRRAGESAPPTTCSAATSRSSTASARSRATAAATGRRGWRPRSPSGSSSRSPPASPPSSASCARCGEVDGLVGFSGAAGGVVCEACERGGFPLSAEAHAFMVEALGAPARAGAGRRRAGAAPGRARDHRDARAPRPRAASRLPRRLAA